MDNSLYGELSDTLSRQGSRQAIDQLCRRLEETKEYGQLFYAMLLKKRHELGVSLFPTEPSQSIPAAAHASYEEGIRDAARHVGNLFLKEGDIPRAWMYFRMLGEPEPIAKAISTHQFKEEEDPQQIIEIAFHQGVHPRKGFDWILEKYGICSAITMVSSHEFSGTELREYCIQGLIRTLYEQLRYRLAEDIAQKEGQAAVEGKSVAELIRGRDWLFADEYYHIDVSHLGSVVQMSIHLPNCPELQMARELCAYGQNLSQRFQYPADPPFEDQYRDYGIYLSVLAGDNPDAGLAHFYAKAENADPETIGVYPAEVLANLLLRINRVEEALKVARRFLSKPDYMRPNAPNITELCRMAGNFEMLSEVAREQGDPVHYLVGLLSSADRMLASKGR